ncbi:34904_t:CDS:1, partial [Racocetra persica]
TDDDIEEHWSYVIKNWIDMLDIENHLESGEIVNEKVIEFEFEF